MIYPSLIPWTRLSNGEIAVLWALPTKPGPILQTESKSAYCLSSN